MAKSIPYTEYPSENSKQFGCKQIQPRHSSTFPHGDELLSNLKCHSVKADLVQPRQAAHATLLQQACLFIAKCIKLCKDFEQGKHNETQKGHKSKKCYIFVYKLFFLSLFLASLSFLCYLAALSTAIIWIQTVTKTLVILIYSSISLAEDLYGMLAFILAGVLAKDIQLKVAIQDD